MKKSSQPSKSKKKTPPKPNSGGIAPLEDPFVDPPEEENLAGEQFAVVGREDEASSSGHRVEPIEPDEEGNAQKLIEEGLHGHLPESLKKTRRREDGI